MIWICLLWILSPQSLDKVMPSRLDPGLSFLCTVHLSIYNARLPVPLLALTSCKVLAFLVLRHKSINFFVYQTDCHRLPNDRKLLMQLHLFDFPTGSSGFYCFKTSANKSFASFKLSQRPSKRLKSIQVCNS